MAKKIDLPEDVYYNFSVELWKAVKYQGRSFKPPGTKNVADVFDEFAQKHQVSTAYWQRYAYSIGYQPYTR